MAAADEPKKPSGCGLLSLYGGICRRRSSKFWHRRCSSTGALPRSGGNPDVASGFDGTAVVVPAAHLSGLPVPKLNHRATPAAAVNYVKAAARRKSEAPKALTPGNGLSGELDSMIYDHQRAKGSSGMVRATSGNMMVYGNLGNIRRNRTNSPNRSVTSKEVATNNGNGKNGLSVFNGVMGNIVKKEPSNGVFGNVAKNTAKVLDGAPPVLCRALSKRQDPEELKEMGNEEYKKGRFAEALALYDRAILMDPGKALYLSNKAAALTGLGRILDAVGECREAVRIEPSYYRAHHRLASLYFRLGEAEKAVDHYKLARNEARSADISQAQALQTHLSRCTNARKIGDWKTVLKEAQSVISVRADSAPQVFALQAEALLKLDRHDDAESTLSEAPKFDIDASTKFLGASRNAYVLMIRAEVGMATGRFEDAIGEAQQAAQLDPSNRETSNVVRRTQAVASARSKGNDLFKASKFGEACMAYGEGLEHTPHNAILLCNRAACRSKLGQWERAIQDCNTALVVRPSYSKARLRRADCNAKLERWEASVRDYEALLKEIPGDGDLMKALSEAQLKLKKQQGKHDKDIAQS